MGTLQVSQIRHRLEKEVVPTLDLSDLNGQPENQVEINGLSRAVAAFAVMRLWNWDVGDAAASVTDGSKDGGLDAIAIDPVSGPRIMLVQSKWSTNGNGSASKAEMLVFKEGVDRLVQGDKSYFSEQIQDRWAEIEAVIYDPQVRIDLTFCHTGSGSLADEVDSVIAPLIDDLNEHQPVAAFRYLDQAKIHAMLLADTGVSIDLDVELSDFGVIEQPARSFYGHVSASDVAKWGTDYGDQLFASNLRSTLPDSSVNEGIIASVVESPEKFWYYNNGITALCTKVEKAPAGSDRRVGTFRFSGVQVVNGAQTVGSISTAANAGDAGVSDDARVMVRFIELEGTDETFGSEVTRWTNTQNRVGGRDFLALDPEQTRIADEFKIDGLRYIFRSGEEDPAPADGCGVQESTVALACVKGDVRLAVQAKREVSRLWADIERAPYKTLFNPSTTSHVIWRSVEALRLVDEAIEKLAPRFQGRERSLLNYLNRVILWTVSQHCGLESELNSDEVGWSPKRDEIKAAAPIVAKKVVERAGATYPGYPANLAKNATECTKIASWVLDEL